MITRETIKAGAVCPELLTWAVELHADGSRSVCLWWVCGPEQVVKLKAGTFEGAQEEARAVVADICCGVA